MADRCRPQWSGGGRRRRRRHDTARRRILQMGDGPGVDAVQRGAKRERQMRAAICAGAMPKPDVKDALPSWPSTLQSRFSARRAYGGRHSSSGAPGFLAGPADVAAGVEPESDGDGSSLAACFEAYGSSAPFSASSSVPVISDTAMKGGESVRRHTCSASSGFDCCRLLKPLVLNLLERCDPRGDPDGLVSMGGCNDTQPRPASIRAPPMPIRASRAHVDPPSRRDAPVGENWRTRQILIFFTTSLTRRRLR